MGNRPPNIDRFVRLLSKYLPIRYHCGNNGRVDYVNGCNGTRLVNYDRDTDHFVLTRTGRDFLMTYGSLYIRNEQFPDFLLQISFYHLDYQINELVQHIINSRYNNYHQMIPLRDSNYHQMISIRDSINRRLQKLRRRQIVDQSKILVCESMLRMFLMSFSNMEIYLRSKMSQQSPPCDEIPTQPTHVEIRTQLA